MLNATILGFTVFQFYFNIEILAETKTEIKHTSRHKKYTRKNKFI